MRKLTDREFSVRRKTLSIGDEIDIELEYEPERPYNGDEAKVWLSDDGGVAVVGYLVHDTDCENPMTSCDGEGRLVHSERNYEGYDPSEIGSELAWERDNNCPNPDERVYVDGRRVTLWELACEAVALDLEQDKQGTLEELCGPDFDELLTCAGDDIDSMFEWLMPDIREELEDPSGAWCERVYGKLSALYKQHWRQLVSPFVVEASYSPDRYSRTASANLFRGDAEDVDALWIGGDLEEENITHGMPEFTDELEMDEWLRVKSMEYAHGVILTFNEWAEGNCYGCVVETFRRLDDGETWEQVECDSCWSYIGFDYATEVLENEYVAWAVNQASKTITSSLF